MAVTRVRILTPENAAALYIPRWNPLTAYTVGQAVVSPSGDLVTAKVAFTSGSSYDAANWNLSSAYAPAASVLSYVDNGNGTVTISGA